MLSMMIMTVIAASAMAAEPVRSDAEVRRLMAAGDYAIKGKMAGMQRDLERATRLVLTYRADCISFIDSYYAPDASKEAKETVFRVTCEVRGVPGGYANFYIKRSRIGDGMAHIWRFPK